MQYSPIAVNCEICGGRRSGKNHPDHTLCSKIKQRSGLFKSKDPTPSKQRVMARGYEFMVKLMNRSSGGLREDT